MRDTRTRAIAPRAIAPRAIALCALCAFVIQACATPAPAITDALSPAEFFQRAQDAAESGNNELALRYYQAFTQKYPDDRERGVWASYEIAFLYHKMGDDKKALSLFNDLLGLYTKDDKLPEAPRILAEKVKARIEAKQAGQTKPATPS